MNPTPTSQTKTPAAQARQAKIDAAVAAGHPLPRLALPVHPGDSELDDALLTFDRFGDPLIDGQDIFEAAEALIEDMAPAYVEDDKTSTIPRRRLLIADPSDRERLLAFTSQVVAEDDEDAAGWAVISLGRMVRASRSLTLSRVVVVLTSELAARHWCDPADTPSQARQWVAALGLSGRSPESRMRSMMEHLSTASNGQNPQFPRLDLPSLASESRFLRSSRYGGLAASSRSYQQAQNVNTQAEAALSTDAGMLPITLAGARAHVVRSDRDQTQKLRVRIEGSCRLKEGQQVLLIRASNFQALRTPAQVDSRRVDPTDGSVTLTLMAKRTFHLAQDQDVLIVPAPFIRRGGSSDGAARWDPRRTREGEPPKHQIPLDVMIAGAQK